MLYALAADFLVIIHLLFIGFVIVGGLLLIKWRWLMVLHLPAVAWAALLEFKSLVCPLTPLEQTLRHLANQESYSGGFIQHYLLPVIYPSGLQEYIQIILGILVIVINTAIYLWVFSKRKKK